MEPLEDVDHLSRLDGPRAVVERQRDLAERDAATDGNLARRHHVAGDRARDRDPADPEPSERGFRVAEMPTGQTFDRPAGSLDAVGPSFTRMASPDARRVSLGAAPPFNSMRPGEFAGSRTTPETDRS